MHNFKLLRENVDTSFISKEIKEALVNGYISVDFGMADQILPDLELSKIRKYQSAHIHSNWQKIISEFILEEKTYLKQSRNDSSFLYKSDLYKQFPRTISFVKEIAMKEGAYVQRLVLALLLPEGDVYPHIDEGEYYRHRDRYHLVIESEKGSEFTSGDEKQIFREGELWWFANKEIHSVKNLNKTPRIHLIFDLLPKNHRNFRQKIIHSIYQIFFQKSYDILGKNKFTKMIKNNTKLRAVFLT